MKALRQIVLMMAVLGCALTASHAQARGKRLIMKDGSYQVATKWEVTGDRVRYYSAERYDWEEIPANLIDWNATDKYESERVHERSDLKAEAAADKAEDEAAAPLVAPGIHLPESGGVF